MDFPCSALAYEAGQGLLTLRAEARITSAIGNQSIEKFNGAGWDAHHPATSFSVAAGDIVLIRRTGIRSCPGLIEQIRSLTSTKSNNDAESSSTVHSRSLMPSTTRQKRKRDSSDVQVRKCKLSRMGLNLDDIDVGDLIDLCSDSD
jgi:hypothetical protein